MIYQNESKLLKIIKFLPSIFLIIISLISLSFLYLENIKNFNKQKEEIQKNYIAKNKEFIKERINSANNYIIQMQKETEKELVMSLKNEMNKAYDIAYSIYERNKDKYDEQTIKELIKDAIRPIRFNNGRGYFFIHDKSAFANTMHPIMPRLEGKNSYNVKDAKGNYIIRQMHEQLKIKDETIFEWYWYKPGNKETQFKKIGYIRNFKPFNWFIGTGEYVVDYEKVIQEKVLKAISKAKYKEDGYIFVVTYDGVTLAHLKKHLIGKNIEQFPQLEDDVKSLIKEAIKNKNGYATYSSIPKPQNNLPTTKNTYYQTVDNWQWVIGTGFYEDDVNKTIEQKKKELDENIFSYMKNTIFISIILAILLLILCLYLANIVSKKFASYKEEIDQHIQDKSRQQHILYQQVKMAAMGEMIGNIAHQWRQPLSSISSLSTGMVIQQELGLLNEKDLNDNLNNINQKAQYLSKTIDDFRNYFNANKNRKLFKLKACVNEAISLIDASFKNENIQIIQDIDDVKLLSYKNEFIQVLINLLNNSKDALAQEQTNKFIFITAKTEGKNVNIQIKDSAGGVDKEIINKIFEPYFTTKHQTQGTGIGLYMSNEIITKHMKGQIKVSNKEFEYEEKALKGALFEIIVPIEIKNYK